MAHDKLTKQEKPETSFEIRDVEYENYIIRTAQRIVDLGEAGVNEHISNAYEAALVTGNHLNAYMQITKSDLKTANILVSFGLNDSVLMRQGMWRIREFTFFTTSNKWNSSGGRGKLYYSKSIEHFIDKYVFRN